VKWADAVFKDVGDVMKGGDSISLTAIKDADILAGAKRILENLGKANVSVITLADVTDTAKIFAATRFNGDGVVPADAAGDDVVEKAIKDIIDVMGGVTDRSGKPGVNLANLDAFFAQAAAYVEWESKVQTDPVIVPLGADGTAAASAAIKAVKTKVDDFFARCRLAAFDARALMALNREEKEYLALAAKDLTITAQEVAGFPLARIEAGRALPLSDGLNPAWADAIAALVVKAVTPLLGAGRNSLSEEDWKALQAKVAPFDAWSGAKPAAVVEKLGTTRLRDLLKSGLQEKIAGLIRQDQALEKDNAQIASVEKTIRFQRDLYELLTNYVNFADFYGRTGAVFQAGTLYLDARSCHLCIEVVDAAKHATLAGLAGAYLAYCDVTRPGAAKKTVVALFTDGDSDNLMVGRNGVFYDRKGQDWDATIAKVVSNPISVREAFLSPYKKFVRMIEEQIAKRAAAADADAQAKVATAAQTVAQADKTPVDAAKVAPKKIDVGTVAALGVALGSIGTLLAMVFGKMFSLGMWMPIGLLAIVLLISGPSMLLAWLKLRNRNLGPILDANGWAINTRAKMNVPFGEALTDVAKLPAGAERSLEDPFAEKKRPWKTWLVIALVILGALYALNRKGLLYKWTGGIVGKPAIVQIQVPFVVPAEK
jgi:hypothetical protein